MRSASDLPGMCAVSNGLRLGAAAARPRRMGWPRDILASCHSSSVSVLLHTLCICAIEFSNGFHCVLSKVICDKGCTLRTSGSIVHKVDFQDGSDLFEKPLHHKYVRELLDYHCKINHTYLKVAL